MPSIYSGLNKSKNIRLFENPILEQFTFVHPVLPALIFVPVVIYCLLSNSEAATSAILSAAAVGLLFWTLTEYTLHRFVFHYPATSKVGKRLVFLFHGIHHDDPEDARRLVMPPVVSIVLASVFYVLFQQVMLQLFTAEQTALWLNAYFAGFIAGYLCYDYIHYYLHHATPTTAVGKSLKQYHMLHHFVTPNARFGVSSPLWDIIVEANPIHLPRRWKARKEA